MRTSNQLTALTSHQLVGQTATTPNHYMIHLSNANSQDPQTITIEPMTNGLHSSNGCTFSSNDLPQLTSLNAAANEVCLDGSGINLTALSNGQLPENCLLTSDTDLCWNTILTDELGTSAVYSTNSIPLTAIPIASSQSTGPALSPVSDSQQTVTSSGSVVTSSMSNTVTSSSSQSPSSANLLADNHAQVQNLILSSSTNSNSICTTSYCISTSNVDTSQFSNQMNAPMNGQHLNGSETVVSNVVTCSSQVSAPSSVSHHQPQHLSSWPANGNYMNLVFSNQSSTAVTELTSSNGSPPNSSTGLNSSATLNSASNENHGSPVVIQISSNGNCLSSDLNSAHQFDGSNSMPTWIECTLQGSLPNGKVAFESNAFDLDNFSDLDNC